MSEPAPPQTRTRWARRVFGAHPWAGPRSELLKVAANFLVWRVGLPEARLRGGERSFDRVAPEETKYHAERSKKDQPDGPSRTGVVTRPRINPKPIQPAKSHLPRPGTNDRSARVEAPETTPPAAAWWCLTKYRKSESATPPMARISRKSRSSAADGFCLRSENVRMSQSSWNCERYRPASAGKTSGG